MLKIEHWVDICYTIIASNLEISIIVNVGFHRERSGLLCYFVVLFCRDIFARIWGDPGNYRNGRYNQQRLRVVHKKCKFKRSTLESNCECGWYIQQLNNLIPIELKDLDTFVKIYALD